jgi:hypothetical protein
MTAKESFFSALVSKPDVDRVGIGWAVPHSSHVPGLAKEGNRCRERAFVVDAGSFIYVTCHCGSTPFEIADDLGIARDILQPFAAEQSAMLKVQRRLRADLRDADALELLTLLGLTVAQAMLWKPSDAGSPPEMWAQEAFHAT